MTVLPASRSPLEGDSTIELSVGPDGRRTSHGHIERAGRCACPRRRRIGRGEGVGAGRQVRRSEAPGAGAARGRRAECRRAAIRHRHRGTIRCGSRQGHKLIGIGHAGANDGRGGGVWWWPVTVTSKALDAVLVPADVVSVAVKA